MRTPAAIALIAATAVVVSTASASATRLLTGADIQDDSITGADIRNGSIKHRDLAFDAEATNEIHTNHAPKGKRTPRDEGGYMWLRPDATWTTVDTLNGIPAGTYFVQSSLSVRYNMAGAIDVSCAFTTSSGASGAQGTQQLTLNLVPNKTNQYQTFNMAPMVVLSLPQDGSINLVCKNAVQGGSSPVAMNTYFYATPLSTYNHT